MADTTSVVPTRNPVVTDPATIETSAQQTSAAATTVAPTTQPTTSAVQTTTSPSPSSAAPSSSTSSSTSDAPSSSSSTTSIAPSSTSSAAPTTSSATPSSTSSATEQSTQIVTVTRSQVSAPGLVTNVSASRASSSASKAASTGGGKGGIGGSGLPIGGLVGIIIGALAVLALVGLLVTRSMRKRARAKRTANRSSLFEPWPAPVAMEDEPYEKPAYDAGPAQSYPMQNASNEMYTDSAYPAYGAQQAYQPYNEYPGQQQYGAYPPQPYADMEGHNAAGVGTGAVAGAAVGAGAVAANGIHDGMMVRVKVAFVRSLEDELAITAGQQLYLHTAYDDGWTLCEDQAQNRGVVPFSCLEPWEESAAQAYVPPQDDQSLNTGATTQRRSSLYAPPP